MYFLKKIWLVGSRSVAIIYSWSSNSSPLSGSYFTAEVGFSVKVSLYQIVLSFELLLILAAKIEAT